ncbi:MAG: hypothetical protein GKC53_02420 [Neisseriaceae bacterium]|nr:MAG: hypothetical protein GKC53_02420 [Neisseriaceae bacterium]
MKKSTKFLSPLSCIAMLLGTQMHASSPQPLSKEVYADIVKKFDEDPRLFPFGEFSFGGGPKIFRGRCPVSLVICIKIESFIPK